jgi:hypothetical protein
METSHSAAWKDIAARQRAYIIGPGSSDLLDLVMATALCPALGPESPVWLLIAGPPSSGKTDTARRIKGLPSVKAVDAFTGSAFSTGYRDAGGRPATSLLDDLHGKILLLSDLASFFEQNEATVKKVLGELTAAYDGEFSKATGTVGVLRHVATFGLLGCTTRAHLDRYEHYIRKIGSRFLFYRLPIPRRSEQAALKRAVAEAGRAPDRAAQRSALTERVHRHLTALIEAAAHGRLVADLSSVERRISIMAEVLAACRGVVAPDYEVEQIEGASRAYQQLRVLGRALAMVRGREVVGADELDLLWRVVLGSMPIPRARAVRVVTEQYPDGMTVAEYQEATGLADTQAYGDLRTLVALDVLTSSALATEARPRIYRPENGLLEAAGVEQDAERAPDELAVVPA